MTVPWQPGPVPVTVFPGPEHWRKPAAGRPMGCGDRLADSKPRRYSLARGLRLEGQGIPVHFTVTVVAAWHWLHQRITRSGIRFHRPDRTTTRGNKIAEKSRVWAEESWFRNRQAPRRTKNEFWPQKTVRPLKEFSTTLQSTTMSPRSVVDIRNQPSMTS